MRNLRTKIFVTGSALATAGLAALLPAVAHGIMDNNQVFAQSGRNVNNSNNANRNTNSNSNTNSNTNANSNANTSSNRGITNVPDYDKPINTGNAIGGFRNPLQLNTVPEIVARGIRILLALVGMVSVVVIIIAGFRMVSQGDNPQQVTKARKAITWAILGLLASLLSFSLVAIIQRILQR